MTGAPILEVTGLHKTFGTGRGPHRSGAVTAVAGVELTVGERETVAIVGESGSGKTTVGRCVTRLLEPNAGTITFQGRDITHARHRELRPLRRELRMIFQDSGASLNPRRRVGDILESSLALNGVPSAGAAARALLDRVGLSDEHFARFPHELSGGQRQRVNIARALGVRPRLVVCDEPTSALDVSVQAQICNLLKDLQRDLNVSYLFISHDLGVVRSVAARVAVMYLGTIVEIAAADSVYRRPVHPYTRALLASVPRVRGMEADDPSPTIHGEAGNAARPPSGCRFHPRCPRASEICSRVAPLLVEHMPGHAAACHHPWIAGPGDGPSETTHATSATSTDQS